MNYFTLSDIAESQNNVKSEKARYKRIIHSVSVHLGKVQSQVKLICEVRRRRFSEEAGALLGGRRCSVV